MVGGLFFFDSCVAADMPHRCTSPMPSSNAPLYPILQTVCDPVQGDHGQLYVSPELPPAFASELAPIATIMTPNQFEMELLTGQPIASLDEALAACQTLHSRGPRTVVSLRLCALGRRMLGHDLCL